MTKVAVIQLNSRGNVNDNLQNVAAYLRDARAQGVELAVLPENFAWMGHSSQAAAVAESIGDGPIQRFLADICQETGLWLIAGSIRLTTNTEKVTNTTLVYDNTGKQLTRYDKIHLFDAIVASGEAYKESDTFKAGSELSIVGTPAGPTGLTICYDLRFPALFNSLSLKGAKLIAVPAAFTQTTGKAHWQALLRARAIENQVYILAAAQTGLDEVGRETYGHALIVDPWGRILNDAGKQPGFITAEINLSLVDDIRENMPIFSHAAEAKF